MIDSSARMSNISDEFRDFSVIYLLGPRQFLASPISNSDTPKASVRKLWFVLQVVKHEESQRISEN